MRSKYQASAERIPAFHAGSINAKIEMLREQMHREERVENPACLPKRRSTYLLKTYDMCSDKYQTMYEEQDGLCAICGEPLDKPKVDHNHATGEVRQLLCGNCNSGIGMFKESQTRLRKAIAYLVRWNGIEQ
jgi:hypothetical protein